MRFLVDNQLAPALARFISQDLQVEAIHVQDAGLAEAADADVWIYASRGDWILVTRDEDFVDLFLKSPVARLLWVRIGNCRRVQLIETFRNNWLKIADRFDRGERFVELR